MLLMALPVFAQKPTYQDRLYGQITTRDGDVLEGFIRWDKNEASWVDILDGSKRFERTMKHRSQHSTIRIFGLEIEWDDDDDGTTTRLSGIRFGHLKSLENTGSNQALLTLRSDQEIELHGGSTDIGNDVRGIVVEQDRDEVELRWRDVERVDFMAAPRGAHQLR